MSASGPTTRRRTCNRIPSRRFGCSRRCGENRIKRLAFSSTGSIYGEPTVFPTPEDAPFPVQTSLYGASKMACEGLISAYCEGFGFSAWIFRFVSILGERYTHGHVFDFYQRLRADPATLHVLGNGKQRKSYLYVQDCIDAIFTALERVEGKAAIFNSGRRRVLHGERFHRLDHGGAGNCPAADLCGRRAGLDRRLKAPSSSSIARVSGSSDGRRSSRSNRGSFGRSTICAPIPG